MFYLDLAAAASAAKNDRKAMWALDEASRPFASVSGEPAKATVRIRGTIAKRKGAVYERAGDFEEALRYYIEAAKIQTNKNDDILAELNISTDDRMKAKERLAKSNLLTANQAALPKNKYRKAMDLAQLGRYNESEDILKKLVVEDAKESDMFYLRLARIYAVQERYREACIYFRKRFAFDPLQDHLIDYEALARKSNERFKAEVNRRAKTQRPMTLGEFLK